MVAINREVAIADTYEDQAQRLLEAGFYLYLFSSGFLHLVANIPGLPFALVATLALLAALRAPNRLAWALFPATIVSTMLLIDLVGYSPDLSTLTPYLVWTMVFALFLVLHEDQRFFERAKLVLFGYLAGHLYFASPDPADPSRLSLSATPLFGIINSNELAYWCGFGVFASMVGFWTSATWRGWLYLAPAGLFTVYLLATVSRSGLLVTLVALAVYFILSWRRLTPKVLLATVIAAIVATAVFHNRIWEGVAQYQHRGEQENEEGGYSGRVSINEAGLRIFLDSPLFGTGRTNVTAPDVLDAKPPHNAFLAMGVHYGIIPTLMLLTLWLIVLGKAAVLAYRTALHPESAIVGVDGCELLAFALLGFMMINVATLSETPFYSTLYMTRILSAKRPRTRPNAVEPKRNGPAREEPSPQAIPPPGPSPSAPANS